MKIKKSDVDRMIKEEFQKMLEKKKLSTRLSQINEELGKMNSEDSTLNEVEAGAEQKTKSAGWSGPGGDTKWKPEFEKIGSHLKEDDMTGEEPAGEEMAAGTGEEMGAGEEAPMAEETPMGEFEAKFAEIGKAIDAKLASEANGEAAPAGPGEEMGTGDSDEDFEEVEVSPEGESKSEEIDETAQAVASPVSDSQHLSPEKAEDIDKPTNNLKGDVQESVEEPLEGHSVAQEVEADKVNDNMEKDKHVKEGAAKAGSVITETEVKAADAKKNIFTEGIDEKKKTAMLEEFNRMKKFAGLSKDEE